MKEVAEGVTATVLIVASIGITLLSSSELTPTEVKLAVSDFLK